MRAIAPLSAAIRRPIASPACVLCARQLSTPALPESVRQQVTSLRSRIDESWRTSRKALEQRLARLGDNVGQLSGYQEIDLLKQEVLKRETMVEEARTLAKQAKAAYEAAVQTRAATQRESNELIQRRPLWTDADVSRYTELVKLDHVNDQAFRDARLALERAEEAVDQSFSELLRVILARYHEEQIRSLSTYGSLGITAFNALIFILALLVIEPWRRRRLADILDERISSRLAATSSQTPTSEPLSGLDELVTRIEETDEAVKLLLTSLVATEDRKTRPAAHHSYQDTLQTIVQVVQEPPSTQAVVYGASGALLGVLAALIALWR